MLFGIGDGGGGPGVEHLERLRRIENLAGLCPVKQETASAFFEQWSAQSDAFPTWVGELYLEKHQGTFTTNAKTKLGNRRMEHGLRELEFTAVLNLLQTGGGWPDAQLDRLWKETLLYQFHDILPGSSIKRVYDECEVRYDAMLAEVEELLASQQQSVVGAILQQAVVAGSDGGSSSPVSLFNSLSWSRTAWVKHGDSWIYARAPPLSVSFAQHAEGDLLVAAGRKLDASSLCIENEFLRVRFDRDGSIASVYDKENLREVLALGSRGNKLAVYHDTGDAWDFPMDYADQTPRYMQLTSYESAVNGPCVEMQQQYQLGKHTTLSQTIRLTAGSRRIDFVTAAHWREPKAMLRTSFPVAVHAEKATYEIQFGAIERPTHRNTTWDLAKDECPAHKWADLSQRDYGVALLNDCKYGYKVKGNELDLNLLRSVVYPRDPLEPKDDCRADGDPVYGHTDQDDHTFTYALYPHLGDHVTGQVVRHGYELNIPLRVADGSASADPSTSAKSLLTVSTEHVVVETVKAAEDLSGRLVFRLYEASGSKVDARIEFGGLVSEAREVNLMEEPLPEAASEPLPLAVSSTTSLASVVSLQFLPFEIKTLLVAMPADGEGAAGTGGKRRKRC